MEIYNKNRFAIEDVIDFSLPSYIDYVGWKGEILYYNPQITFSEIPNEVSLTIPTICYSHCSIDCNSKFICWIEYLEKDNNLKNLNLVDLNHLIKQHFNGISCVTIMTSLNFERLNVIFDFIKNNYPTLKTALYLGKDWEELIKCKEFCQFKFSNLDYIKIGSYKKKFGGLDNKNCNQRFYKISHQDIGELFERNIFECQNNLFWKENGNK